MPVHILLGRDALPRVPNLGLRSNPAPPCFFRDAKSRCRSELHRSGRGGSTPPSCRVRVANFDSEVPALNRRELGANPRRPTISASVVKLQSSSASNGEFAGGSPAGCTNSCRVSPTTRGAPLRTERLGVELPHAAPFWNVHRPSAPGLFARQCVPPGKWCESTAFRNFRKDDGRMQNAEAPGCR